MVRGHVESGDEGCQRVERPGAHTKGSRVRQQRKRVGAEAPQEERAERKNEVNRKKEKEKERGREGGVKETSERQE